MPSKKLAGALGAIALGVAASASPASAAEITVNTAANNGAGSLRAAINTAENTVAHDDIVFAIPGQGVHTITPATMLPTITRSVTIDGYSQERGATPATDTTPATPTIVINAANVARGIDIGGDDVEVRGLAVRDAQADGIFVEGNGNTIAGNHVGTSSDGMGARPNAGYGVVVHGQGNVIGGPEPEDRNVIASNTLGEVFLDNGSGHLVQGNRIGTNALGTGDLGTGDGVVVEASDNTVQDNLISGEQEGVVLEGTGNTVAGNFVGTGVAGLAAIPNGYGVTVTGEDNTIGDGNVIAGNNFAGIQLLAGAHDTVVEDNSIGVGATGAPLGNGAIGNFPGVMVLVSPDNRIEHNVISNNAADGVALLAGADRNAVLGNTLEDNDDSGVGINGGRNNRISGGNAIAGNGGDGVTVRVGVDNSVTNNSIHDNGGLAIDLADDDVTPNDDLDGDSGPNRLQNGPEIQDATAASVDWELNTEPNTTFRIEVYENDVCDPLGSGEAQRLLGSDVVTTNGNGDADGSVPVATSAGKQVSMTATKEGPGGGLLSTSELSPCEVVVP